VEHDVGVDDEDGGRVGVEAAGGRVAGGAGGGAAGDVVAEVVLPDDLRGRGASKGLARVSAGRPRDGGGGAAEWLP
jgi:hypothetical protein